jgi:hypothetical protein
MHLVQGLGGLPLDQYGILHQQAGNGFAHHDITIFNADPMLLRHGKARHAWFNCECILVDLC